MRLADHNQALGRGSSARRRCAMYYAELEGREGPRDDAWPTCTRDLFILAGLLSRLGVI